MQIIQPLYANKHMATGDTVWHLLTMCMHIA